MNDHQLTGNSIGSPVGIEGLSDEAIDAPKSLISIQLVQRKSKDKSEAVEMKL